MRSARELLTEGADSALRTVRLTRRVNRLEEGVRENALLAGPLEEQVARIEQSLVPLLDAAHPDGTASGTASGTPTDTGDRREAR
jgi:hypothetical protein